MRDIKIDLVCSDCNKPIGTVVDAEYQAWRNTYVLRIEREECRCFSRPEEDEEEPATELGPVAIVCKRGQAHITRNTGASNECRN